MFQGAACTTDSLTTFNDFAQTILLGITAAGSIAILQNICSGGLRSAGSGLSGRAVPVREAFFRCAGFSPAVEAHSFPGGDGKTHSLTVAALSIRSLPDGRGSVGQVTP